MRRTTIVKAMEESKCVEGSKCLRTGAAAVAGERDVSGMPLNASISVVWRILLEITIDDEMGFILIQTAKIKTEMESQS